MALWAAATFFEAQRAETRRLSATGTAQITPAATP